MEQSLLLRALKEEDLWNTDIYFVLPFLLDSEDEQNAQVRKTGLIRLQANRTARGIEVNLKSVKKLWLYSCLQAACVIKIQTVRGATPEPFKERFTFLDRLLLPSVTGVLCLFFCYFLIIICILKRFSGIHIRLLNSLIFNRFLNQGLIPKIISDIKFHISRRYQ